MAVVEWDDTDIADAAGVAADARMLLLSCRETNIDNTAAEDSIATVTYFIVQEVQEVLLLRVVLRRCLHCFERSRSDDCCIIFRAGVIKIY